MDLAWAPSLRRKIAWDIVADDKISEYSDALGLVRASEDVDAEEKSAAYNRLSLLGPIGVPLTVLTTLAGDVLARSLYRDVGLQPSDDDVEQLCLVVQSGCHAVIAEMLDMHVLSYGPAVLESLDTP